MSPSRNIIGRLASLLGRGKTGTGPVGHLGTGRPETADTHPYYFLSDPCPQNSLDIFRGEWSSKLPGDLSGLEAGEKLLFEDPRIGWFLERIGGAEGKRFLELGPLEGGHTYQIHQAGADSILAIEANIRAYLKCLIIKELLRIDRARFICGDFLAYLRRSEEEFDVCLACGVLYHVTEPVEMIARIARIARHFCLWTLHLDDGWTLRHPALARVVERSEPAEHEGFRYSGYRARYDRRTLHWTGFCGGGRPYRYLLRRDDILRCLEHFGFDRIEVGLEEDHEEGPTFAVVASRS